MGYYLDFCPVVSEDEDERTWICGEPISLGKDFDICPQVGRFEINDLSGRWGYTPGAYVNKRAVPRGYGVRFVGCTGLSSDDTYGSPLHYVVASDFRSIRWEEGDPGSREFYAEIRAALEALPPATRVVLYWY